MKVLNGVMFLFISLFVVSCGYDSSDAKPGVKITNDVPLFQEGEDEQIEIGYIENGEFHFTVSEDELQEVYNHNLEINIEGSGELQEADVIETESSESTYFLVMTGSLNEEGSFG